MGEVEKEIHLVLDSGPIIAGLRIDYASTNVYTIQEVIDEIRDKKAREFLNSPLLQLVIRTPSPDALSKVVAFCKKTGDYRSLSATDIKVLALTLTLEMEKNGDTHIRLEPKPIIFNNLTLGESLKQQQPQTTESKSSENNEEKKDDNNVINNNSNDNESSNDGSNDGNHSVNQQNESKLEEEDGEEEEEEEEEEGEDESDSDNEDDWITPENFESKLLSAQGHSAEAEPDNRVAVYCCTTDFAMQNIVLQMGMQLKSLDGLRIRNVKNWILRCFSCLKVCPDREKVFCPSCGNDTLQKLSVVIKDDGEVLYFPPKRQISTRGTQFSIPKPKVGRANQKERWIYAEDQMLKFSKKKKKRNDNIHSFDPESLFSEKRQLSTNKTIIGSKPRRNPNEVRRKRK